MKGKNYWLWVTITCLVLIWPARGAAAVTPVPIACGDSHSLAIKADGTLWAWGDNGNAQLGLGDYSSPHYSPAQVQSNASNWVAVAAGAYHSLGLQADGTLYAWGFNNNGQLGVGVGDYNSRSIPTLVYGAAKWVAIAAGKSYSLGLQADGTLWGWGSNVLGELGLGDNAPQVITVPTKVGSANTWKAIAASSVGQHSLGIQLGGTLWAWGDNLLGQLGLGYFGAPGTGGSCIKTPTQVPGTNWVAVGCGALHSLGTDSVGWLYTWGYNGDGQLGLGTTDAKNTPTSCYAAHKQRVPAGGYYHSMFFYNDGRLMGMGSNIMGELGVGDYAPHESPTLAATSASNWVALAVGYQHNLGLRADGTLWAWGYNANGRLGLGDINNRNTPVKVQGAWFRYSSLLLPPLQLLLLD